MSVNRILRRLLVIVLSLLALGAAGAAVLLFVAFAPESTVGEVRFARPLKIPPLAPSHVDADGTRVFALTAQRGTTDLLPGEPAPTLGYNGSYLGPTLRASRGERVRVEVRNRLRETTTVHWHGMHLPAVDDGGPHQTIAPGETWSPSWRIDQAAATLWYHPHAMGLTEEQIGRGLAGMFIVDDPHSPVAERLPHRYGVDDIPVIVQDRKFDGEGEPTSANLGDELLVDGTYGPYLDVTTRRVRLRVLNASTARVYAFGLSDGRAFQMIAGGGGLLPAPVRTRRIRLAPAERAEIVVTMKPGERLTLRSYAPDLGENWFAARFAGGQDSFDVLQLRASERLRPSPPVPATLAPARELDVDGAPVRTFDMQGRKINGRKMSMTRVDEVVPLNRTEIWKVTNTGGGYHDFHVHDEQFRVLSVNGRPPGPKLAGPKDTVFLPPGSTVRLAVRFTEYADPEHPYMYHCHLLNHEDRGMMGQFTVVERGSTQEPAAPEA